MRPFLLALILFAVASLAGAARGDDDAPYAPPEFLASPPALPPGSDGPVLRLGLDDARAIALQQNLGIALERKQVRGSRLAVAAAIWSLYEPVLSLGGSHAGAAQPPPTRQAGAPGAIITSTSDAWQASVAQRLPTGAQLSLGLSSTRVASSAGTAVEPLTFGSTLSFSLTQPLLRGFSRDLEIPRYSILIAKLASEQERHQLEITAATAIQQTESAYWDVVLALYAYGVAVKSQQAAEDMMALIRRQIAAGLAPSSELTGAESTLAQRKLSVLTAEAAVDQSWDVLRTTINLPRDQWTRPILTTDLPRFDPGSVPSPEAALETAIRRRPEIAQTALDLEASRLALHKAENDALPQIDLGVTGQVFGQDATYGGALDQLGGRSANGWGVTLNLTWTPMQRASKIAIEQARLQHEIRTANREQRVQSIWNDVRTAIRSQRAAALQVIAASKSRTLASQSLEIENRKYVSGTSSNINVATLQNGLASAELSELSALLGHEKAATALLVATGQLLERRHIRLELAAPR